MKHKEPYQDNYGEVNKVNSRKPMIPLKYEQSYKGCLLYTSPSPRD